MAARKGGESFEWKSVSQDHPRTTTSRPPHTRRQGRRILQFTATCRRRSRVMMDVLGSTFRNDNSPFCGPCHRALRSSDGRTWRTCWPSYTLLALYPFRRRPFSAGRALLASHKGLLSSRKHAGCAASQSACPHSEDSSTLAEGLRRLSHVEKKFDAVDCDLVAHCGSWPLVECRGLVARGGVAKCNLVVNGPVSS